MLRGDCEGEKQRGRGGREGKCEGGGKDIAMCL